MRQVLAGLERSATRERRRRGSDSAGLDLRPRRDPAARRAGTAAARSGARRVAARGRIRPRPRRRNVPRPATGCSAEEIPRRRRSRSAREAARRPGADTALFNAGTAAIARRRSRLGPQVAHQSVPLARSRSPVSRALQSRAWSRCWNPARDTTKRRGARGGGGPEFPGGAAPERRVAGDQVESRAGAASHAAARAAAEGRRRPHRRRQAPATPRPRGGARSRSPKRSRSSIRSSAPSAMCAPIRPGAGGWPRAPPARTGDAGAPAAAPAADAAARRAAPRWTAPAWPSGEGDLHPQGDRALHRRVPGRHAAVRRLRAGRAAGAHRRGAVRRARSRASYTLELELRAEQVGTWSIGPIRVEQGDRIGVLLRKRWSSSTRPSGAPGLESDLLALIPGSRLPAFGGPSVFVVPSGDARVRGRSGRTCSPRPGSRGGSGSGCGSRPRSTPPALPGVWSTPRTSVPGAVASRDRRRRALRSVRRIPDGVSAQSRCAQDSAGAAVVDRAGEPAVCRGGPPAIRGERRRSARGAGASRSGPAAGSAGRSRAVSGSNTGWGRARPRRRGDAGGDRAERRRESLRSGPRRRSPGLRPPGSMRKAPETAPRLIGAADRRQAAGSVTRSFPIPRAACRSRRSSTPTSIPATASTRWRRPPGSSCRYSKRRRSRIGRSPLPVWLPERRHDGGGSLQPSAFSHRPPLCVAVADDRSDGRLAAASEQRPIGPVASEDPAAQLESLFEWLVPLTAHRLTAHRNER